MSILIGHWISKHEAAEVSSFRRSGFSREQREMRKQILIIL